MSDRSGRRSEVRHKCLGTAEVGPESKQMAEHQQFQGLHEQVPVGSRMPIPRVVATEAAPSFVTAPGAGEAPGRQTLHNLKNNRPHVCLLLSQEQGRGGH